MENSPATAVFNHNEKALDPEFETVFRDFHESVYRTAFGVTGRAEDAEDVVQTVFLRLLRQEIPPDLQKNPKAYFYRAAFNTALTGLRSRRRRRLASQDTEALSLAPANADSGIDDELEQKLAAAMERLTPESAQIVILRYVHGCDLGEIARILGTTRSTVAVSLFRSRARLKKALLGEKS